MSSNSARKLGGRKKTRRQENKRIRAAERSAIEGARPRMIHHSNWSRRPVEPIHVWDEYLGSGPKKKRKKARPPKERCPGNPNKRAHEYLRGSEEIKVTHWWPKREVKTHTRHYKLCVWCGDEKKVPPPPQF